MFICFLLLLISSTFIMNIYAQADKMPVKHIVGPSYDLWRLGSPNDVQVQHFPGAVLIGGGPDCDDAFKHFILNANGGDLLVLRASGADDYNPYIMQLSLDDPTLKPLNSVTTILTNARDASFDATVLAYIRNAAAIFVAGGDQGVYLDYWSATPVQSIIQDKLVDTTYGGTSAGLAIMGNYIYPAHVGSATSEVVLANPYDPIVELASAYVKIPYMGTVFTDTHFCTRDRMGRLLTFLSRELQDGLAVLPLRGVGVDEQTALILDVSNGNVRAVGKSFAFICTPAGLPKVCVPNQPLTSTDISCIRLNATAGDTFSFKSFTGQGVQYINSIVNGAFTVPYPEQYGPGAQPFIHTDDA